MKLMTILGTILMILAFVVMFGFIIIPAVVPSFSDAPIIHDMFQTLFCKPGETIADAHATYNPEPGKTVTTVSLSCVNNENQAREIDSAPIIVGTVGFLVPFLIGLFMVIVGTSRNRKPQLFTPSFIQPNGLNTQGFSLNSMGIDINMDENGEVTVKTPDGRVLTGHQMKVGSMSSMLAGGASSLTDRLKDLKSALDSGLITQSEYDEKREEILKER